MAPTPERKLWNWPTHNKYCGKRESQFAFEIVYKNMFRDGSCKNGFKRCGDDKTIGKGICVPDGSECPLTSVKLSESSPNSEDYQEIEGNGKNLYFSNKPIGPPVVDLDLSESHICSNLNVRSITKGRNDYPLIRKSAGKKCQIDTRYEDLYDAAGERTLFDLNNVVYFGLPGFQTSDQYLWKGLGRGVIQFSPSCQSLVPEILQSAVEIQSVKKDYKVAMVRKIFS